MSAPRTSEWLKPIGDAISVLIGLGITAVYIIRGEPQWAIPWLILTAGGAAAYGAEIANRLARHPVGRAHISRDDDGTLDEIYATSVTVHLEAMNDAAWHLIVTTGAEVVHVSLGIGWADGSPDPDADDLARLGLKAFAVVEVNP